MALHFGTLTDGAFSAFIGAGSNPSPSPSSGGGGGVIYRDKKPTKKECEKLYLPKIQADLEKIIAESRIRFIIHGVELLNEQEKIKDKL